MSPSVRVTPSWRLTDLVSKSLHNPTHQPVNFSKSRRQSAVSVVSHLLKKMYLFVCVCVSLCQARQCLPFNSQFNEGLELPMTSAILTYHPTICMTSVASEKRPWYGLVDHIIHQDTGAKHGRTANVIAIYYTDQIHGAVPDNSSSWPVNAQYVVLVCGITATHKTNKDTDAQPLATTYVVLPSP